MPSSLTDCPGPGRAAAGYLCLYPKEESGLSAGLTSFVYSTDDTFDQLSDSVGVVLYGVIDASGSFASGVWTVTAS
jgi:hypothetical protein